MELRPDLWHCADCETAYAVGLTCCPQCSSTRRAVSDEDKTWEQAEAASPSLPVRKTEPEDM